MTEIPDDVVERAQRDFACAHLFPEAPVNDYKMLQAFRMRAAGRVFVEWERERTSTEIATLKQLYEHAVETRVYYLEERNKALARADAAERKLTER